MDNVMMEEKVLKVDKSNWQPTKLGELATEISKRVDNPSESKYDRFVGLGNFISGDIKIKSWETTKGLASSAKAFEVGDVLFARRNAYLRRASMVDFEGCCSGDAFVLRENHDKVVPGFLAFLLNSDALWIYANSNAAGTMSKRVKWRDLAEYEFLLPPKDQQAKLAELLWAMDEVIEKDTQLLDNIVLNLIVNEKLIFASKTYCALKTIILNSLSGGTPNTKVLEFYSNGTIPWLTTKIIEEDYIEIGEKFITNDAVLNSAAKVLPKGNIIAGTRVGVGKFSVNLCDISFSQDVTGLIIDHSKVNIDFLVYQLNSVVFQSRIEPFLRGTTIKGILKDDLLNMKIYLPSMEKQLELKNLIKELKNSRDLTKSKISSSKALQKSLINQVF